MTHEIRLSSSRTARGFFSPSPSFALFIRENKRGNENVRACPRSSSRKPRTTVRDARSSYGVLVYKEPLSPRRVARRLLPRRHPIPVPFRKAPPPSALVGAFTRFFSARLSFRPSPSRRRRRCARGRRRQVHARCVRRVACRSHLRPARGKPRTSRNGTSVPRNVPSPSVHSRPFLSAARSRAKEKPREIDRSTLAILRLSTFLEFFPLNFETENHAGFMRGKKERGNARAKNVPLRDNAATKWR